MEKIAPAFLIFMVRKLLTMRYLTTLLIVFLTLSLTSCKEHKEEPAKNQMAEVMAIHDEVMPRMGEIAKLVGELKPMVDSTAQGQKYEAAVEELQIAHKSMMDWMQNFGNRFDPDEILHGKELTEQKQEWLDEEEERVRALRDQINSSIEKAEAVLAESEKN